MDMKMLTRDQYRAIFYEHMQEDFAQDELKPLAMMYEMADRGIYTGYGLFEENRLVGYVFLVLGKMNCGLIDYLAVCPEYRNGGYGSEFLTRLGQKLKEDGKAEGGLILESEKPSAAASEEDRKLRSRRIGFYERNGFRRTGLLCELFGVAYTIMYRPAVGGASLEDEAVYQELKGIYTDMGLMKYKGQVTLEEKE
jgi:GNAT superfamily N-acetyltransferase